MAIDMQPDAQMRWQRYQPGVNDFALMVATKNGSGSQTSNVVLIRSLFKMGIPVSGKNLFPSNIKGLPTWYTIRASKDGYTARRATTEVAVAFNQDTITEDIANIPHGGVLIANKDLKYRVNRPDITVYEVPVKDIMSRGEFPKDFADRIANMVYVGVCCHLFGIPLDIAYEALLDQFNRKEKPARMNFSAIQLSYDWAKEYLEKRDSFRFEPMNKTQGKILIEGNDAAALGALFGGVTFVAWYPITPSTSLVDNILNHLNLRKDGDGKNTVAIVQAEDELAAVGMIIGAGWAGARSMTATSGPGVSLMAEFTGLAYFAEIPTVIWDVTRMGPSTGLPTRTSQGDLLFLYTLSHGDTRHIVLLPSNAEECFEFGWKALDIAEQMQTPVFVMSDLDIGMNVWLSNPFQYPDTPINHGKTLNKEQLEAFLQEKGEWFRYRDYDADGVGYRTVPGTEHPGAAYFTRGTGHNDMAIYSERREDWLQNMQRLRNKFDTARHVVPGPVMRMSSESGEAEAIGIISFGSNDPAVHEAIEHMAAEGITADYMRIRALPFSQQVWDFIEAHDRVYVIENNFDGQLCQILRMESPLSRSNLVSLTLGDTLPMTALWIHQQIVQHEEVP
ncbi:MAG: 2-oxoacid:acceptor oxidoreductase subunit alpha [Anaerolineae bacterium]|nr:2-oxoacid:acceptor oxidoreductase subunit alpha [Anaerolineae bacterium]